MALTQKTIKSFTEGSSKALKIGKEGYDGYQDGQEIYKTLDPANNSIGLYGLADMEKRNKAVLKATHDTYKSEIKKAKKDMWAKDPIDYVTGIFQTLL